MTPKKNIIEVLKLVSPGTMLRRAIDDIIRARDGALIVVESDKLSGVMEGGFRLNCKFTAEKLTELSKMDGAVILSKDLRKILYANVLMIPDSRIETSETGTRHKAAERTAKQIESIIIAISERRNKITLYYCDKKQVLGRTEDILDRVTETLQVLEKQREIYNELVINLNVLEITNLVSISDISSVLQRTEVIMKMADLIKKDIVELGKEGTIVKMRLRELIKNLDKEKDLIIRDYADKPARFKQSISSLSFENILDSSAFSDLFGKPPEENIQSHGYRLLAKTSLGEAEIASLVKSFKSINNLIEADVKKIYGVLKDKTLAKDFFKELQTLKENISVGKNI